MKFCINGSATRYSWREGRQLDRGLTTYLADHLYEERKQEGWAHRKQILIDE
jgi:hypothetical protein